MICIKIYARDDGALVFDSAPDEGRGIYLSLAKRIVSREGRVRLYEPMTVAFGLSLVAISPEARAILAERLADTASYDISPGEGDLEILPPEEEQVGWKNGLFAYKPHEGETQRVIPRGERFTLKNAHLYRPDSLLHMTVADNGLLRDAPLSATEE